MHICDDMQNESAKGMMCASQCHQCVASNAATTSDGYPLSQLSSYLKQPLKKAIVALFDIHKHHFAALEALMLSNIGFWQDAQLQWKQAPRAVLKKRILRNAFGRAVLGQLEEICWRFEATDLFCFVQKQPV